MNTNNSRSDDAPSEIIRGLQANHSNLSVSTRRMRRLSIEHKEAPTSTIKNRPTRRITMNQCSRQSRRGSPVNTTTPKPMVPSSITRPIRRITMNLCSRPSRRGSLSDSSRQAPGRTVSPIPTRRRPTMQYSTSTVPLSTQATRRISMDMSKAEPRRISMNLTKSFLPRDAPPVVTPKIKPARRGTSEAARSA